MQKMPDKALVCDASCFRNSLATRVNLCYLHPCYTFLVSWSIVYRVSHSEKFRNEMATWSLTIGHGISQLLSIHVYSTWTFLPLKLWWFSWNIHHDDCKDGLDFVLSLKLRYEWTRGQFSISAFLPCSLWLLSVQESRCRSLIYTKRLKCTRITHSSLRKNF
jgi:hypothetical protein